MSWLRRWRIDSRAKWATLLRALLDMQVDFAQHPSELIVREEREPIPGWARKMFHAVCAEIAPHWGLTPAQVKTRIKEDFYGAEFQIERGKLTDDEILTLQRLLNKMGPYELVIRSSEDSDGPEYVRLVDHAYLMAADSNLHLADRRRR